MIWMLLLMAMLVLCSAFFSSSEITYATANKLHIRSAAEARYASEAFSSASVSTRLRCAVSSLSVVSAFSPAFSPHS